MAPPAESDSASVTSRMLSTGRYSDMTITCEGKTFKCHKAVVCIQSKPLAAAMDGNFKESKNSTIDLDDNLPDIVHNMLDYLYNKDFSDGRKLTSSSTPKSTPAKNTGTASSGTFESGALLTNAQMFVIGDKYNIQGLKQLAKKKYEEVVTTEWNSDHFVASLKVLYEETCEEDRLMRDVAIKAAGTNMKELLDRGDFVAICKDKGELAVDVMKASLAYPKVPQCSYCEGDCVSDAVSYGTKWYCQHCLQRLKRFN